MKRVLFISAMVIGLLVRVIADEETVALEKPGDVDPLMKLATARARVEISLRDAAAVFDKSKNGYVAAETAIEQTRDKITDVLSKAKEQNEADRKFVTKCERMAAQIDKKWDSSSREYDTDISPRYDGASESFDKLKTIFNTLAETEQDWKEAKLSSEPLEMAFVTLEKRLSETVAQGKKAIDDLKDGEKTWAAVLTTVEEFVSTLGKDKPEKQ